MFHVSRTFTLQKRKLLNKQKNDALGFYYPKPLEGIR